MQFTIAWAVSSQVVFTSCHLVKASNNVDFSASVSNGCCSHWRLSHNSSWPQLLAIDCLLAMCGHAWLVLTQDCLQTRSGLSSWSSYIASAWTAYKTPPTTVPLLLHLLLLLQSCDGDRCIAMTACLIAPSYCNIALDVSSHSRILAFIFSRPFILAIIC
jgi:hypothetical protein